jgi:hypothetical protein
VSERKPKRRFWVQAEELLAELVLVKDAQRILGGLSRTQILKMADAGKLGGVLRFSDGTRLFRRAEVERLANERRKKKKKEAR